MQGHGPGLRPALPALGLAQTLRNQIQHTEDIEVFRTVVSVLHRWEVPSGVFDSAPRGSGAFLNGGRS